MPSLRLGLLVSTLAIGFALRLVGLADFPRGVHGDEGWTGIRALHILKEGWIGFWDPVHSIGQLALPEYLTAPFLLLPLDPVVQVRLPMALLGCGSLALFAAFASRTLPFRGALFATALLSLASVHAMLSRMGFPPMAYFFFASLVLFFAERALSRGWRRDRAAVALSLGIGLYSYGAFVAFALPFLLWAALECIETDSTETGRMPAPGPQMHRLATAVTAAFAVALVPFVLSSHQWAGRAVTATAAPEGRELSALLSRALGVLSTYLRPAPDGIDGLGITSAFPVTGWLLVLAGVFLVMRSFGERTVHSRLSRCVLALGVLCVPIAGALSGEIHGLQRRSFAFLLPLCWLAGLAVSRLALPRRLSEPRQWRALALGIVALLAVAESAAGLWAHFRSPWVDFVFCQPLTAAARRVMPLQRELASVQIFSSRWSANYETLRYLLPDVKRFSKSNEFRNPEIEGNPPAGPTALVFLDAYMDPATKLMQEFPEAPPLETLEHEGSPLARLVILGLRTQ